jgi:hypothetical protein
LQVNRSLPERIVQTVAGLFPTRLAAWLESSYPEWFLPPRVVLKREMDDHPRNFEAERHVYGRLRPLQGGVIPRLLGELEYDGARALLRADIGGVCLASAAGGMVLQEMGDEGRRGQELGRLLGDALGALAGMGVSHDDTKLDNFQVVGEGEGAKVMVVDL